MGLLQRTGCTVLALALLGCSPQEAHEIRNVVLISMDTTRADHLGCYGYPKPTSPHLDALASEGTLFRHAISPVPSTLPAHSTMLTGTDPLRHGVRDNDGFRLDEAHVTLAEVLSDNGFHTGAIVGAFVLDSRFGLDQGFQYYNDDFGTGHQDDEFSYVERSARDGSQLALSFLEENQLKRFFLFLHFFDPHSSYSPPRPFVERFGAQTYAGEIAYTDWAIGLVIDKLKELDLYESSLIVVTSDHGESLGEHGELSHAFFIYQSTQRIPLIVRVPGGRPAREVTSVVGLVDIMPTVLSLLGLPVPARVQGRDLSPLLFGPEDVAERQLYCESLKPSVIGANPLHGLVGDRWKYIHGLHPELYDLRDDPRETRNLIEEEPQRAGQLREALLARLAASDAVGGTLQLDDDAARRLEALGYLTGITVDPTLEIDPQRPDARDLISVFVRLQNIRALVGARQYEAARIACNKLLDEHPETALAYGYLGRVALAQRRWQEAASHFQLYLALTPGPPADLDAEGLQPAGTPPLQLEDRASVHSNLGVAYTGLRDFARAAVEFERAGAIQPLNAEIWFNLGGALQGLQRHTEALTHYRRALELDPGHQNARGRIAQLERLGAAASSP